jgi:hypothetical protein
MKRYFGPPTLIFLGIWLVLMIGGRTRFFQDPGTFWHVATGNHILADGFIDTDPFTFTFAGKEWIPYQWLGECAMAVLDRVGGFDLLLLTTCTILSAVYTGLGIRLLRCGLHPSVVAVVLAGAIAASSGHFHVRPHVWTIAGMAALMVYLTDFENGRLPTRRLLWLIPIFWLWANTHGGALGGLATLALAVFGWTVKWRLRGESPIDSWRGLGWLVLLGLACTAVCFAGPYTYRLPLDWLQIYRMESLPHIIKEHTPLDPEEWAGISVIAFGVFYCALLATVPFRRWRVTWLLAVVWLVLAFSRVRHGPLFAVAALVAIADFFPLSAVAASLIRRKSDLFNPTPDGAEETVRDSARPFLLPAVLVLLAVVLQIAGAPIPVLGRGWARLDPTIWPVELLPELQEHQFDRPGGTRIFCEYAYGGFLIYQTPGYRVFIDDRCEVFGDEFLVKFVDAKHKLQLLVESDGESVDDIVHPAQPFAEWQQQYGAFDFALVETGGGFDLALAELPQAWEAIRQTETATLYRKRAVP